MARFNSGIFDLTNISFVREEYVQAVGASVLYTAVVGGKKIDDRPTVGLTARGRDLKGGRYKVVAYVAADESALPMQFVMLSPSKYRSQTATYTEWNEKVSVSGPRNALKIPYRRTDPRRRSVLTS